MMSSSANMRFVEAGVASPQPPHVEFLGLPFCLLPQREVVSAIIENCGAPFRYILTPNSYEVVIANDESAGLLPIYRGAWLSLCDSRIVRALARLEGRSLPLVTGSDLVATLFAALNDHDPARRPPRLLIVGPPAAVTAALRAAYPNLMFDVLAAPAGLAHHAERRLAVARACLERPWDILLLCVGVPAQALITRQLAELGRKSGIVLNVGAAIDFLTGARARAPLWVQKLGLEWAYRLVQEPARLWRRYLVESPKILRIFMAQRSPRGR
jgi:exopolysaccharide biosynthesis WecB/TagA/CpsF family protein